VFDRALEGKAQTDPIAAILVHPKGYAMELFRTVDACVSQPRRLEDFRPAWVTVIHDVAPMSLAEDILTILSRAPANRFHIDHICQATVLPPVPMRSLKYRLNITWIVEPDSDIDVTPLAEYWDVNVNRLEVTKGWYAGYTDLMKLKDMESGRMLAKEPQLGTIYSTPHFQTIQRGVGGGRGGRGGRGGYRYTVNPSLQSDPSSTVTVSAYVPPSSLSASESTWASVVRSDGTDMMTVITNIVDQRMQVAMLKMNQELTESIGKVKQQVEQLAVTVSDNEIDRQVMKYSQRLTIYYSRIANAAKDEGEKTRLRKERENLLRVRAALLTEHGDKIEAEDLPEVSDF